MMIPNPIQPQIAIVQLQGQVAAPQQVQIPGQVAAPQQQLDQILAVKDRWKVRTISGRIFLILLCTLCIIA